MIAQSGVGCDNTMKANKVPMSNQVLTKNETSDDTWQLVGEGYSSFVTVLEEKKEKCPILNCQLYEEGCQISFGRVENIKMNATSPW